MFFLIFLLIILIIFLCLITIRVKIKIVNLELNTLKGKGNYIKEDFFAVITIYILEKVPIGKIKINKAKLKKMQASNKLNKMRNDFSQKLIENENNFDKDFFIAICNFPLELYNTSLKLEIGTKEVMFTTFLIPFISTIIALILKKYAKNNNQKFKINPVYDEKNILKLEFKGIFEIKMIHIINTICILKKKKGRVKKNVRTSNRRSYDYSYE